MRRIDSDEWIEKYRVETEGEPGDLMPKDIGYDDPRLQTHPNHIWTHIEPEYDDVEEFAFSDEPYIFSGFHWVNRMAHYFSEVPFDPSEEEIGVR